MEIHKTVKGGYDTFALTGQLDTAACVELRPWVFHTLEHTVNHICFDLTSLISIDKNGYRFLKNLKKALEPSNRHIAIFGANATLEGEFKSGLLLDGALNCYPNLHVFENSFIEQYQTIREKLYAVADGSGIIRGLHLRCPMCKKEDFGGYLIDEANHKQVWEENEMTPQWVIEDTNKGRIDWELYEVAVCPRCLFASVRLDHFDIILPEGEMKHVLDQENLDTLSKTTPKRHGILTAHQEMSASHFFSAPREKVVGYPAWKLYDITLRGLSKGRRISNPLEVSRANMLCAKYAENHSMRQDGLTTAHVWLQDMIQKPMGYSTIELAKAYVYSISVGFALERPDEVKITAEQYMGQFGKDPFYQFWTDRISQLMM